jgi:hypothetical protein
MKHTEVDYWSKRVKHFMKLDSLLTEHDEYLKRGEYGKAKRCNTRIQRHLASYDAQNNQKMS